MTVSSSTSKGGPYSGDGSTTVFTVPFYFLANADLLVTRKNADGTETTFVLTTDYSVSGAGNPAGGLITCVVAPATGTKITISRNVTLTQGLSLPTNGLFPAKSVEQELDTLTMIAQQLKEKTDRSVGLQVSSTATVPTYDDPVGSAVLQYSSDGKRITAGPSGTDIANAQANATAAIAAAATATAAASTAVAAVGSIVNLWCGTAGGSANALTLTLPVTIGALTAGMKFRFIVASTNTSGNLTANVGVGGDVAVKKTIGAGVVLLAPGDFQAATIREIEYDGTQFQLLAPSAYSQSTAVASASTINLDTVNGDYISVTGTTTITAITLARGREATIAFAGALILTNGASLVLPSGANITTAAGDTAIFRGESAGDVRCISYQKASGQAIVASATSPWVSIKTQVVSGVTTVDFVNGVAGSVIDGTYKSYKIVISDGTNNTANEQLMVRTSANAGSSYDSGASNYYGRRTSELMSGAYSATQSNTMTEMQLTDATFLQSTGHFRGEVIFDTPNNTGRHFLLQADIAVGQSPGNTTAASFRSTHCRAAAAKVDGLRFYLGSGNNISGTFELLGLT